jgi:Fuc2NAc and GlcNAc transferase
VTSAVGVINLVWLLPLAVCVTQFGLNGVIGVIVAYVPLVVLAFGFRAGELERN